MSILGTAISGLQASQTALSTAGHNISNANTEGYSRQRVEYVTNPSETSGAGSIGTGVSVSSIERIVNEFLVNQLRLDTASYNDFNQFNDLIGGIDSLLADASTGIADSLQSFFSSLQNSADDPSSTPARDLVLTEAQNLALRFNTLYDRMDELTTTVGRTIEAVISQVNTLADSVAELNQSISESVGRGITPNDLLDEREELLRQMSELVSIQVAEQDGGAVNVLIGKGQQLVVGRNVATMGVNNDDEITLGGVAGNFVVTQQISGGQLGGLLRFSEDALEPSFNQLGVVALAIADEFNRVQALGLDLNGEWGGDLFTDINTQVAMNKRVVANSNNNAPNDRNISLSIDDVTAMTNSDYTFVIQPNSLNYVVTRKSDDTIVRQGTLNGYYPTEISFDGLTLNLESGSFQGGDRFDIYPSRFASQDIDVSLQDADGLAFAGPIRTLSSSGNTGNGNIMQGEVLSTVDTDGNLLPAFANKGTLSPPLIIVFTSPTTYDVLDNSDPSNPVDLDPPMRDQTYIPGVTNYLFTEDPEERLVSSTGAAIGLPEGSIASTVLPTDPAVANGYPGELMRFTLTDPTTGAVTTKQISTVYNASAAETAARLNAVAGVSANAYTTASITDVNIASFGVPLQVTVNGQNLLEYDAGVLVSSVPDPSIDEEAFNDYLAEQINSNSTLSAQGISAVSAVNPVTGHPEVRLVASSGVNLDIRLEAAAGDTLSVNDGENSNVRLTGVGAGQQSAVTVGGHIDVTLSEGVAMSTLPTGSQLFGDSTAADFAKSTYTGYQVSLLGAPDAGDTFTVEFNKDASTDNRNALAMVELETADVIGGKRTFSEAYGQLVERVGTQSSLAETNTNISESLLATSQANRDSVSGVNLDEEAANLIRFEQAYNANAQVISVARDLFDTLLNAL